MIKIQILSFVNPLRKVRAMQIDVTNLCLAYVWPYLYWDYFCCVTPVTFWCGSCLLGLMSKQYILLFHCKVETTCSKLYSTERLSIIMQSSEQAEGLFLQGSMYQASELLEVTDSKKWRICKHMEVLGCRSLKCMACMFCFVLKVKCPVFSYRWNCPNNGAEKCVYERYDWSSCG